MPIVDSVIENKPKCPELHDADQSWQWLSVSRIARGHEPNPLCDWPVGFRLCVRGFEAEAPTALATRHFSTTLPNH